MTEQRPPACLNDEAVLRWLLAERDWLLGPVALAQHLASEVESPAGQQLPCCGGTLDHDLLCPNFED